MEALFVWFLGLCVYRPQVSSICVTQNELNIFKIRLVDLLKGYDMSVFYNSSKENVVVDALSHITMGSVSHVEETKNDLVK